MSRTGVFYEFLIVLMTENKLIQLIGAFNYSIKRTITYSYGYDYETFIKNTMKYFTVYNSLIRCKINQLNSCRRRATAAKVVKNKKYPTCAFSSLLRLETIRNFDSPKRVKFPLHFYFSIL